MGSDVLALTSRSQRSHSHQGITGKFLCSQIKHPEIQVSLSRKHFQRYISAPQYTPNPSWRQNWCFRPRLAPALQPGLCNPLSRAPPKAKTESEVKHTPRWKLWNYWWETHHSHGALTSSSSQAPSGCSFLCISLCTPVWASPCLQAAQPKRRGSLQD